MSEASTSNNLLIYGAGGHGLVVAEAAACAGWKVDGFVADDPELIGHAVGRWTVLAIDVLDERKGQCQVIIAIGDNGTRLEKLDSMRERGIAPATVLHPRAWVSELVSMGKGVFIGAGAIVQPEAKVGDGVIVNSGAIVEHHCELGESVHVAPGAVLTGNVTVGARTLVGAGAAVKPGVKIGEGAIIGAGAVVVADVADGATVVGNPARARE